MTIDVLTWVTLFGGMLLLFFGGEMPALSLLGGPTLQILAPASLKTRAAANRRCRTLPEAGTVARGPGSRLDLAECSRFAVF